MYFLQLDLDAITPLADNVCVTNIIIIVVTFGRYSLCGHINGNHPTLMDIEAHMHLLFNRFEFELDFGAIHERGTVNVKNNFVSVFSSMSPVSNLAEKYFIPNIPVH